MKEQGPESGKEQRKLTIEPNQNTLERKGIIFMAEGNGGGGPDHGAPQQPDQSANQEAITRARRAWEEKNQADKQAGHKVLRGDRETQALLIRLGISPEGHTGKGIREDAVIKEVKLNKALEKLL